MPSSIAIPDHRPHQKSRLSDSDVPRPKAAKILIDSETVRDAQNLGAKAEFLALVDEARIRAGLSKKEMAINAAVPDGAFSEALSGTRGNFAIHWLDRQPQSFWLTFHKITAERYHLTPESASDIEADRIGELVALLIKSRRTA